jgi:hypothetical protein
MGTPHRCACSSASPLLVALLGLSLQFESPVSGAPADEATLVPCPATGARLVLMHSGAVTLNGMEIGIDKLGTAIGALKPRPTEVCYAQEDPADQSAKLGSAMEVLIFAKIPISLYTDVTFSRRKGRIGGATPN